MTKHAITAVLVSLTLVACSQDPAMNGSPTPTTGAPTTQQTPGQALALYFVNDTPQGLRLFREFHRVTVKTTRVEAALAAVMNQSAPLDPDYVTLWPKDAFIESVSMDGDTAIIDVTFSSLNVGSEGEERALDQLVWTATAAEPTIKSVRFLRSGKKVESFAGHVDTTTTFSRQPSYEVLGPIWITSVNQGDTVRGSTLVFSGLAQVFEASVQWQVLQQGKVIAQGVTTAAEAAPARTVWTVQVDGIPAGPYTLRAFSGSAKDGSLFAEDTKDVAYTK